MFANLSRVSLLSGALVLFLIAGTQPGLTQSTTKGSSGLPLPRFVSLKAEKVNLRIGPSTDYAVSWRYLKSGLPVEIIREYENWRQIRDADGTEGWVSQTLLSGQRTAVAAPWMRGKGSNVYVMMRRDSMSSAAVIAKLEPGVVVKIEECNGNWCKAETQGVTGWVSQEEIWGAYPGEAFK